MSNQTIFLSHFLTEETPGYGGKKDFKVRHMSRISEGANSNSQEWTLSNHIGTHIDLPSHFDDEGSRMEHFKSDDWIFNNPYLLHLSSLPGTILDINELFEKIPMNVDFLIIKTDFQKYRNEELYWLNNPGLSPNLAAWLREKRPNVKCLGFDFISITSYTNRPLGRIAHKAFLGTDGKTNPLRVIEDMKLDQLVNHPKSVIVAPILIFNADGAPVTVIATI
jgi:arylformamidase